MDKKNKKPSLLAELIKKITKKAILDNSEKEKAKAYDIRKIFEQMELDLISSMHRAFYFHQAEQFKEGFNWEQWQLTKLREFEAYRKRNKDIVGKYNKPIQKAIDRELKGNFSNGENRTTKLIERIKNVFSKKQEQSEITIDLPKDIAKSISVKAPQENAFFGTNEKKLEALMSTVKNDLNKASYSVLRKMDDVYRQTIFKTHIYLQNGAKTLNQAIDMATKDFLDKGINSIEYKNGARVNIASYAEMCLRTANHRAMLLGEGKKRDEYGIHLVVVSAHANTCPKCEPWQGKILIDDVFSHPSNEYIEEYKSKYKLVSEAVDEGLLHPNCRHALITYFEGITTLPVVPDGREAIKTYKAEQKQRAHERVIRKQKRIREGSCDEANKQEADKKVKLHEKFIRDILKEHPELRRNAGREKMDFRSIKQLNYKKDLKQFKKFKEILGEDAPKTLEDFQNLKYNDIKEWKLTKYNYRLRNKVLKNPDVVLRNSDKFEVHEDKYLRYLFDGENVDGLAKGKAILSRLGYSKDNYKEFDNLIKMNIGKYPALFKGDTHHGKKYEVNMVIRGLKNKQAKIKVGVMYKKDNPDIPQLTTTFIDKLKESDLKNED